MDHPDALTAEDLRGRLYHSLREKGLVDALKSQLRNKLVSELKSEGLSKSLHYHPPPRSESSLLQKAANSLVADHLRRCKYDYSLSVFVPETGNNADKLFTMKELMQLLHISPESRLYQSLVANAVEYHKKGFLWQLLTEIAQQHGYSSQTTGIQTDPCSLPPIGSIEEEFRKLDKHYASLSDEFKSKMVIEERLLSYQKQLEERSRTEIQLETARFKENELARMRLEERETSRKEIDKARREMERTYRAKLDGLTQRERASAEKLQYAQEVYEKETYTQRQSVLQEIESVRQRESNMHRQEEISKREHTLWEEKVKTREELAKKREHTAHRLEVECEQRIRNEINKFKIEEQSRYLEWNKSLEIREARVKENERRLDDELQTIKETKDELRETKKKFHKTDGELVQTRHDLISFQKQTEILSEKHRDMLDYQAVREDNATLRRETENLKTRIAELTRDITVERQKHEELLREMGHINQMPTSETFMLKKQVEKLQSEVRQEKAVADHQKAQTERRYQDEVERNRELMRRYEEQTLQQRDMIKELNDMRQLLAHKVALTNEVYRNPRHHSLLSRSGSFCDLDDSPLGDAGASLLRVDSPLRVADRAEQIFSETAVDKSSADEFSYSSDIVKETKRRLKSLENEAVNLEQNYRNFQFRMTTVGAVLEDPVQVNLDGQNRSRVTFHDDMGASPPLAGSHHRSRLIPAAVGGLMNESRPMSSTPSRATSTTRYQQPGSSHKPQPSRSKEQDLDASVSTINSGGSPPHHDTKGPGPAVRHRPMSVNDLEARPGSPSVVVMPGTEATVSDKPKHAHAVRGSGRGSPSGEEGTDDKTEGGVPTIPLDEHQRQQPQFSLDSAWKQPKQTNTEAERLHREAEDRKYEEQKRKREEERRQREEQAWEREQEALRQLEQTSEKKSAAGASTALTEPPKPAPDEPAVDPVMAKYMEMVMQQKQKEKQVAKKTINTWNKGKQLSQDKTPSASEEISAGGDTEDDRSTSVGGVTGGGGGGGGGKADDEDFWTP